MLVDQDVVRTLKKNKSDKIKLTAIYDKPVKAPVVKGQQLGVIKAEIPESGMVEIPLVAANDVNKVGFWGRISRNIKYLLLGAE